MLTGIPLVRSLESIDNLRPTPLPHQLFGALPARLTPRSAGLSFPPRLTDA